MKLNVFLDLARIYKLSWDQLCNLAFSLDAEHPDLIEAVKRMTYPPDDWLKHLLDYDFLTRAEFKEIMDRKKRPAK